MNETTTIRVRAETREALRALERMTGEKSQELVAQAVEALRRKIILDETNAAYARVGGGANLPEIKVWEGTLADGLDDL